MITSKMIKNGTIAAVDLKDRSIPVRKLAPDTNDYIAGAYDFGARVIVPVDGAGSVSVAKKATYSYYGKAPSITKPSVGTYVLSVYGLSGAAAFSPSAFVTLNTSSTVEYSLTAQIAGDSVTIRAYSLNVASDVPPNSTIAMLIG